MIKLCITLHEMRPELLYIKIKWKEQPLRFTIWIPWIPNGLDHFIWKLQGRSKLCVSLQEFNESHTAWITVYQICKEGTNFEFRCWNSVSSKRLKLLYIKFTREEHTVPFRYMNFQNSRLHKLMYIKFIMKTHTLSFARGINFRRPELLYNKFTRKQQTLSFAKGIQGRSNLWVSLADFH